MKLLILSSKFPPDHSPEAIHTEFIARVLAGRGVAVTVVTSVWNTARSDLFVVRPVMPGWGFRHLKRLLGEIRRERPDAVLLIYLGWIYDFNPMVTALPWFCRRMQHRPRFVTLFENLQPKQDAWTRRMGWIRKVPGLGRTHPRFGRLLVDGDAVVALARAHLHQLVEAEPAVAGKGIVIPAPPLLSPVNDLAGKIRRRGRSELGVADEALLLAFFGFVYRGKGVEILLHALSILLERNLAVRLVIIGEFSEPDYHTELKSIVTRLGLAEVVTWAGRCDDARASMLLRAADIAVLPFTVGVRLNNSSVAAVASHGLPLVTTAGPETEAEFRSGGNVCLAPPNDPDALAGSIEMLALDPGLRRTLAEGARRLVDEHLSVARMTDSLLAVLTGDGPAKES